MTEQRSEKHVVLEVETVISQRARARIAAAKQALDAGQISRGEFDRRMRGYECSGCREAGGHPALDLTYERFSYDGGGS